MVTFTVRGDQGGQLTFLQGTSIKVNRLLARLITKNYAHYSQKEGAPAETGKRFPGSQCLRHLLRPVKDSLHLDVSGIC
jgi:hypothetical protein